MSDGLTGASAIVQHGLDAARQSVFADPELVPLARTDELLAAVAGPAVKAVLSARIEQIVRHGHTAESDDGLLLKKLPGDARSMALAGMDLLSGPNRNLEVAERRFARAAAMLLAAIDQVRRARERNGEA